MQVKTGTGNKGLDWIFVGGMLAAFPKTADLLSYWSPRWLNDLVGFDVSLWYGAFCAAMVEGTILFLHFDRRAHNLPTAQAIKWIMFGVSFACQIFDGYVSTDTVANMSDNLKVVLTYGIPALPLIITVLVGLIGALPEDGENTEDTKVVRQPRMGLKTRWHILWNGDSDVVYPRFTQTIDTKTGKTTDIVYDDEPAYVREPELEKKNGANPTNRQSP